MNQRQFVWTAADMLVNRLRQHAGLRLKYILWAAEPVEFRLKAEKGKTRCVIHAVFYSYIIFSGFTQALNSSSVTRCSSKADCLRVIPLL